MLFLLEIVLLKNFFAVKFYVKNPLPKKSNMAPSFCFNDNLVLLGIFIDISDIRESYLKLPGTALVKKPYPYKIAYM
jgi:hypothetical protein